MSSFSTVNICQDIENSEEKNRAKSQWNDAVGLRWPGMWHPFWLCLWSLGLGLSHLQQLHSTIGNAQKILGDKKRRSLGGICFLFQDAPCTQNHLMKMCKQRWPCSLHFVARNWNLRFDFKLLLEIWMFHSKWQWKTQEGQIRWKQWGGLGEQKRSFFSWHIGRSQPPGFIAMKHPRCHRVTPSIVWRWLDYSTHDSIPAWRDFRHEASGPWRAGSRSGIRIRAKSARRVSRGDSKYKTCFPMTWGT